MDTRFECIMNRIDHENIDCKMCASQDVHRNRYLGILRV